ncbi:MAG TPA: FoF1 ATP synthase subunit a [Drouetiella sp.]
MLGKNLFLYQLGVGTSHDLIGTIHADTIGLSAVCMVGILAVGGTVAANMKVDGPGGKMQAIVESIYLFVDDLAHGQIGHDYKKFFPLIAAIFTFVLFGNFLGVGPYKLFEEIVPGWPKLYGETGPHAEAFEIASPTTDINVTAGLAIVALLVYLGSGIWKHGAAKYGKTLFLTPMAPIEVMDMVVRPSTLALRLMVVITADELMRGAFLLMCPILVPAGIMAFELFIGVIQAFVFSLLTSIYIGLTVAEHH